MLRDQENIIKDGNGKDDDQDDPPKKKGYWNSFTNATNSSSPFHRAGQI